MPQGTVIRWSFNTKNVKGLHIVPEGSTLKPVSNKISFTRKFMKSTVLKVNTLNEDVPQGDSILYQINVTPDEYPQIAVEKKEDSLSQKIYYFLGDISDDHGFSKLTFHYQFTKSSKAENKEKSGVMPVALTKNITSQHFYHYWNINIIDVQAEDEIEYFFTVWDNDGVNGSKATKSEVNTYKAPSLKELKEQTEEANKEIKSAMAGAQADAKQMEKEINSIEKMLTEKKNLDWNDKKKIQDLLDKQKELEKKIKNSFDKI